MMITMKNTIIVAQFSNRREGERMSPRDACMSISSFVDQAKRGKPTTANGDGFLTDIYRSCPLQCGPDVDIDEATQISLVDASKVIPSVVVLSWNWRRLARGLRHAVLQNFLAGANLAPTGAEELWH